MLRGNRRLAALIAGLCSVVGVVALDALVGVSTEIAVLAIGTCGALGGVGSVVVGNEGGQT